jgi:type I restriction enzyme S subunit
MSGKYQAYPEYKDSGVEWLGQIPSHWTQCGFKRFALIRNGRDHKEVEAPDGNYPVIGSGGGFSHANQYLYDGESVLLGRKGTINKPLYIKGKFWTVDTMFYTEVQKNADARFLYYMALTFPFDYYSTNTALPSMTQGDLANHGVAAPSIEEQRTIAAFLDQEIARIDQLIEKQQRLIELLKEKRQAVISHAVTKGLDPNVPMKDSGVEWLGQVPEHWVVTSLKYFYENLDFRRIPLSSEERSGRQGGYPYYGASGVIDSVDDYLFDEDCVLVGEDGANLVMRSTPLAFVAQGKYWVNNHAHILRMHDGLNDFWAAVINNIDIRPLVSGSAQPKLTAEAMGNITVACSPDVEERRGIMHYLDIQLPKLDAVMQKSMLQIDILKERRTALISAAVTGKIDVRNWQPNSNTQTAEPDLPMAAEQAAEYRV